MLWVPAYLAWLLWNEAEDLCGCTKGAHHPCNDVVVEVQVIFHLFGCVGHATDRWETPVMASANVLNGGASMLREFVMADATWQTG